MRGGEWRHACGPGAKALRRQENYWLADRLQDVDDQKKHKTQHNDADQNELPQRFPAMALIGEFTPVPRVGIIRIGRHPACRRGHVLSLGSAQFGAAVDTPHARSASTLRSGTVRRHQQDEG